MSMPQLYEMPYKKFIETLANKKTYSELSAYTFTPVGIRAGTIEENPTNALKSLEDALAGEFSHRCDPNIDYVIGFETKIRKSGKKFYATAEIFQLPENK